MKNNETEIDSGIGEDATIKRIIFLFPWIVALISITPFLLNQFGFDFSAQILLPGTGKGVLAHTLLQWSAFTIAILTALIVLVHFRAVNDPITLVIGIALLVSGCMDALLILSSETIIGSAIEHQRLLPFIWAIARLFEASILIFGFSYFLKKKITTVNHPVTTMVGLSLVILTLAVLTIYNLALLPELPQAVYPDSLIKRPLDVMPLLMFVLTLFLFVRYYRHYNSIISLALLVFMIPNIVQQLHMALGSSVLFDSDFMSAKFLQIISYLVLFFGMLLDYYSSIYKIQTSLLRTLTNTRAHAQAIVNTAVDGIITIDRFGIMQMVNPSVSNLFGYQPEELIGQNVKKLMPEPYQHEHDSYLSNYAVTGKKKVIGIGREVSGQRKNGSVFPMELAVAEVKGDGESIFTGFIRDISERKQFEKMLEEREELFSNFVNSAPTMMWMSDADNNMIMFNDSWLGFFGTDLEEEIEHQWDGQAIHPDFRDDCLRTYHQKILAREPFDHEYRMSNKEGKYFWFREVGIPRFNNNEFQGYISNLIDITDRKTMEESMRDSMDKLLKSNEELEQFAYVASHDLQEPLRMVASYTQLLSRRYKGKLDEDADEFISYAVDGAKRMQGLIQDLLEYSRVGSQGNQLLPIDSGKVLSKVIANLSIAIEDAEISLTHDEMPLVLADELQLLQLLQNLIGNAIKYRDPEKTGEIHIGVRAEDRYWVFAVKDNGIGIEPKFFDQIFVIFKRLHAPGERSGSGIGLSICKKIIERHGGEIWVESEPGKGSTFFFKLQQYEQIRI